MTVDRTFEDRVLERLAGLGDVTCRPMFGGSGVYWQETIFAILFRGRPYLKVDGQSQGEYPGRGMTRYRPTTARP